MKEKYHNINQDKSYLNPQLAQNKPNSNEEKKRFTNYLMLESLNHSSHKSTKSKLLCLITCMYITQVAYISRKSNKQHEKLSKYLEFSLQKQIQIMECKRFL